MWLWIWLIIGLGVRLLQLDSLPPWTDECATLVFSLGNSFRDIAIDRPISITELLHPLQPNPAATVGTIVQNLMTESTHPPAYFVLAHEWMRLFPTVNGLASLWGARLLPALLGTAAIPAIYGCARLAFGSVRIAGIAAAMMAISPFGVYLSQEARHYTLAILLIIASLSCLLRAVQAINRSSTSQPHHFPWWIVLIWIGINSLGMAVHYFFVLMLGSELAVLAGLAVSSRGHLTHAGGFRSFRRGFNRPIFTAANPAALLKSPWTKIYVAMLGTFAGCAVWLPFLDRVSESNLTDWVADGSPGFIEPLLRLVVWWASMLTLLPMDEYVFSTAWVWVAMGITIAFIAGAIALLVGGGANQLRQTRYRLPMSVFGGATIACLILMLGLTYIGGRDLTLASRFSFIYFPSLILCLAACLAGVSDTRRNWALGWMAAIAGIGCLTVAGNVGYLQTHRSDRMAELIAQHSEAPVLIAATHRHHGHTGRMMGIAWELHQRDTLKPGQMAPTHFLLAHKSKDPTHTPDPTTVLKRSIVQLPLPLDVWAVNFRADIDIDELQCERRKLNVAIEDYEYRLYRCRAIDD
jgi:uncharacterized membrane protein